MPARLSWDRDPRFRAYRSCWAGSAPASRSRCRRRTRHSRAAPREARPRSMTPSSRWLAATPRAPPLFATFLSEGNATSFDGQIYVKAMGGGLTIDSEPDSGGHPGNFTLNNTDGKALIVVGQESLLTITGQTVTDDGFIQVLGGLDLAPGATLTTTHAGSGPPAGVVALEDGGQMTIKGRVTNGLPIDFADGTGSVTLVTSGAAPFTFDG